MVFSTRGRELPSLQTWPAGYCCWENEAMGPRSRRSLPWTGTSEAQETGRSVVVSFHSLEAHFSDWKLPQLIYPLKMGIFHNYFHSTSIPINISLSQHSPPVDPTWPHDVVKKWTYFWLLAEDSDGTRRSSGNRMVEKTDTYWYLTHAKRSRIDLHRRSGSSAAIDSAKHKCGNLEMCFLLGLNSQQM